MRAFSTTCNIVVLSRAMFMTLPRFTVGGTYHDAHDGPKGGVMLVEALGEDARAVVCAPLGWGAMPWAGM